MDRVTRNNLIKSYHADGYTNKEVRQMLRSEHGYNISLSHLKRVKAMLGLRRQTDNTNLQNVITKIQEELNGSGQLLGYRAMCHRLQTTHGLRVDRETVRFLLKDLDPEGVESRRRHRLRRRRYYSRGPLYCIHVDGYDKLKPYGFAVHGAIDGFSRKILWLRVGRSNNNPNVVASYYLDFLKEINGAPRKIFFDRGTENGLIEDMQKALRYDDTDRAAGSNSVQIGKSTSNQRIEQWWSILRKENSHYWMNLFKDMEDWNILSKGNDLQREILRFCFMRIIQAELDTTKREWNTHHLQKSRSGVCPSGKPNILFASPQDFGGHNFKFEIPQDMSTFEQLVEREEPSGTYGQYLADFTREMTAGGKVIPHDEDSALELYGYLCHRFGIN